MEKVLSTSHLIKNYGGITALRDVNLDVYGGQIIGLLGPNGSGKTTLIKIITTLITDYDGSVQFLGKPLGLESKRGISYLPDCEFLRTDIKISRIIAMYADFFADFDTAKATEMLGVVDIAANRTIQTLSKGMRDKLQLILTLARSAKLYIFDEPIAGVDPASRDYILNTILKNYSQDAAVIISTHLISDIEPVLSRVIFINQGQIIMDGDADAIREERKMSVDSLFREEFKCF